jgi:DNA polymerase-3 subunit delta
MPSPAVKPSPPVVLICGEDEFSVKRRSRQLFQEWVRAVESPDQEIIDASVASAGEALKAIARLREALQTLPFFGNRKLVWFQDCNFLGDERAAMAQAVTDTLADLADELKSFTWDDVRLLLTAGKVDKRKTLYKTIEKLGAIEIFDGWRLEDPHWHEQAAAWTRQELRTLGKSISEEALSLLVAGIGPNPRQLSSEAEKLALYTGERDTITADDVAAAGTSNKQARAFAMADALGDRDLPRVIRRLDDELWGLKLDGQRSEIGLLYGLISKVRSMLLLKEMLRAGYIRPEADFNRFKAQLERVPAELMPVDRRFNPLAANPYVLFKALPQVGHYTSEELVRALEILLECNRRLVMSGLDEAFVLQEALVQIVGPATNQSEVSWIQTPATERPLNAARSGGNRAGRALAAGNGQVA